MRKLKIKPSNYRLAAVGCNSANLKVTESTHIRDYHIATVLSALSAEEQK